MAEKQQEHRHELERRMVDGQIGALRRGQYVGLAVVALVVLLGGIFANKGQDLLGFGSVVSAIGILVANSVVQGRKTDDAVVKKRVRDELRARGIDPDAPPRRR